MFSGFQSPYYIGGNSLFGSGGSLFGGGSMFAGGNSLFGMPQSNPFMNYNPFPAFNPLAGNTAPQITAQMIQAQQAPQQPEQQLAPAPVAQQQDPIVRLAQLVQDTGRMLPIGSSQYDQLHQALRSGQINPADYPLVGDLFANQGSE